MDPGERRRYLEPSDAEYPGSFVLGIDMLMTYHACLSVLCRRGRVR
jgi:hypothetical protein